MTKKPDLAGSLAKTAGSTRTETEPEAPAEAPQARPQPSREGTAHYRPLSQRGQRPAQNPGRRAGHHHAKSGCEAFNDFFAKHGKPEICQD